MRRSTTIPRTRSLQTARIGTAVVLAGLLCGVAVANSEVVAVEIIRTVVGSLGLVATVPLTTWLAARAVTDTG